MNIRYLTAAFALVALAACNNEDTHSPFESAVRITATVGEQAARSFPTTALDDVKATQFKEGDEIAISTLSQEAVTYRYTNGKWEPQGDKSLTWETDLQHFTAYYPANKYSGKESVPTEQNTEEAIAAADFMMFDGDLPQQDLLHLTMLRQTARIVINGSITWREDYLEDDGVTPTHELVTVTLKDKDKRDITPYKQESDNHYYALLPPNETAEYENAFIILTIKAKADGAEKQMAVRGMPVLAKGQELHLQPHSG